MVRDMDPGYCGSRLNKRLIPEIWMLFTAGFRRALRRGVVSGTSVRSLRMGCGGRHSSGRAVIGTGPAVIVIIPRSAEGCGLDAASLHRCYTIFDCDIPNRLDGAAGTATDAARLPRSDGNGQGTGIRNCARNGGGSVELRALDGARAKGGGE